MTGLTGLTTPLPERLILTDDPMRAGMLAAHWLDNAARIYELRGMVGYTGRYKGAEIALLSFGYGVSAALLYLHDAAGLGARRVVYIGECFSHSADVFVRDVVVPEGGDATLLRLALAVSKEHGIPVKALPVETDDRFFLGEALPSAEVTDFASAAIAGYAAGHGIAALSVLTVSRNTKNGEAVEEHERQSRFHDAARLAFEVLVLRNT
ncbi:MAG: hypothetical protein FWG28_06480 [Clostridiales bacterium]|nr:hypothetical protein [Clostridiales bacterium]